MPEPRDHGGGLDAAIAQYGGTRESWLDLSTGINPLPYPISPVAFDAWTALPDQGALDRLLRAARRFWEVPAHLDIVAANGASALIAAIPHVWQGTSVTIPGPTYNEHAAAFAANGWKMVQHGGDVTVVVHPNNPDGRTWAASDLTAPYVIDESFCDVLPDQSQVGRIDGGIVLKSFGKFWGLAGARLGFAICAPDMAQKLRDQIGPWSVAGPTLELGAQALEDTAWAAMTRDRLAKDASRLDQMVGWPLVGGTDLFRTYAVPDAKAAQARLAKSHVWSRVFPYSDSWIRLGLPAPNRWDQLEAAL